MASNILEIQNLHKRFGAVEVLKGIDCVMKQGDVVCVIGSSGSGKTTMLRCINMLEDFNEGSINCQAGSSSESRLPAPSR